MQSNRCRHYQLETQLIAVPGAPVLLTIPVRRCHLAEHMIARLASVENSADIARKLRFPFTVTSDTKLEAPSNVFPQDTAHRAAFGPDLEPIHSEDCIVQRCIGSCTPGYVALLEQFGLAVDPDHAIGKGCQDAEELTEDAR